MEPSLSNDRPPRRALTIVLLGLVNAVLFEALTVLATQDKPVQAAAPWQEDPYHAVVGLGMFAVPMHSLVIGLRLLAWRLPGAPDRVHQTARAVAVMTSLVGLAAGFEWASFAGGANRSSWNEWTVLLVVGLAVTTVLSVSVGVLLLRWAPRGRSARWQHDWLGDVVLVGARLLVVRRYATPRSAAWLREHVMSVFVVLSVFAAAIVIGAMAVGERWTDPLLIGWALVVVTASNLAFCVISNAIAGFIARPSRPRTRRVVETAVVTGSVAVQLAVAFHDALWRLVGDGSLTSVPDLVALTLGAGVVVGVLTGAILLARNSGTPTPPASAGQRDL